MKKFLLPFGLVFGMLAGNSLFAQNCEGSRYAEPIFTSVTKELDVKYGENLLQDGTTNEELFLDIYMPEGDSETERPLILLAHGGSFVGGNKSDLAQVCENFAKLGYVAASMQYRLLEIDGSVLMDVGPSFKKEVVRAVHDMKAAIRFFRKSVEEGNPYGINEDIVIVGGFSAGAILANHVTYLDTEEKIPSDLQAYYQSQGGLEGESGNPGYNSTPQMVLSWCGAILDTSYIEPGAQPYFGMHNLEDGVVPNLEGEPTVLINVPVTLQGDSLMYTRAQNIGVPSFYKSYPGNLHCEFPAESAQYVVDFIYEQVCVQSLSLEHANKVLFSVYPNPTNNNFYVDVPANEWDWTISVVNMLGQNMHTEILNAGQNRIQIDAASFEAGVYTIQLKSADGKEAIKKLVIQ